MNRRRIAQLMVVAALIAGCGGSDEEEPATSSQATATATPAETPTPTATPAATEEASESGGGGEVTPLGTKLKVGETATIDYKDASNSKRSLIELTPVKIEKGSLDDFKNIDLDAEQKKSTPYYATVRVKNVGEKNLNGAEPAGYINGVDDRGQDQNEIIFFGDFEACDHETPEKLEPGDEYETCLTYLVPGGGSIEGFHWIAFDEKTGKSDLIWE